MTRRKNKKKKAKKHNGGSQMPPELISSPVDSHSHKRDFWTAMLTILGLIGIYVITSIITDYGKSANTNPLKLFLNTQGSIAGIYSNMLAIISLTYKKATEDFLVKGKTYLLSVLAFAIILLIFTHSLGLNHRSLNLYGDCLNKPIFSVLGYLALFGIIFAISFSKGINVRYGYSKEILK